jgi:uncharacterized hydrophobic protein (TIGR00341 family)
MKMIEVIVEHGHVDTVVGIAEQYEVLDHWLSAVPEEGRQSVRMLVSDDKRQSVMDALQTALGASENSRIVVQTVEAVLPKPEIESKETSKARSDISTREELYAGIEKGAKLNSTFILLVFLSTIVVAIGLIKDNVAVVIAAMVIAPLLGPNIALAFATSLGDSQLLFKSLGTLFTGLLVAFFISFVIGFLWHAEPGSHELFLRTDVTLDSVALAFASGAAAVLSLITGLSSVLVGVMVAIALLPPVATAGLMLASEQFTLATGAGLLLAVNIVSLNLAAKLMFLIKGIKPRTWIEQKKAKQSMALYIIVWLLLLVFLLVMIVYRHDSLGL